MCSKINSGIFILPSEAVATATESLSKRLSANDTRLNNSIIAIVNIFFDIFISLHYQICFSPSHAYI